MPKEKGITLIVVVVTIVILIILAGVSVSVLAQNGMIDKAKEAKFATQISTFYEEYNTYILEKHIDNLHNFDKSNLNADNRKEESDGIIPISKIMPSMKDKYFLERIKIAKGEWVCSNFTQREQEIIDSIVKKDPINNENTELPDETTQKYVQANVNKPMPPVEENVWENVKIDTEIVPVTFDEQGNAQLVKDLSKQWYRYEKQTSETTTGGTSRWANIRTKDGSYFVWIPRFAYKITSGAHIKIGSQDVNRLEEREAGTIQVEFLKEDTNEFWDNQVEGKIETDASKITYTDTGTSVVQNEWFVPEAFRFNGKELTGFWVAKYEASSIEGNDNTLKEDNVLEEKHVQIKPNVQSWRYIDMKNMFGNCIFMGTEDYEIYGFKKDTNTHLMKNIEWGAVSYLAHSQYGRNGTAISANTSSEYITGTGGKLASTTGNYYGVFDMVGGASDAVAALQMSEEEELEYQKQGFEIRQYFDIYNSYNNNQKSDAIYETSKKSNTVSSWFNGLSWLVNVSEKNMNRGGAYQKHANPGGDEQPSIFSFHRFKTVEYHLKSVSFRPTITMEKM